MWTKEQFRALASTKKFAVAVASALSGVTGAAVGAAIAVKRLETKFAQLAEKEIEEAKVFYQQKNKTGEYADPVALAAQYGEHEVFAEPDTTEEEDIQAIRESAEKLTNDLMYHQPILDDEPKLSRQEEAEVKVSISKNVFENKTPVVKDEFDLEVEKASRSEDRPYIISHDEFFENESEYSMVTLAYFEGDDVLTDDKDDPIRDVRKVVGDENLRFGYGSKDNNVVYIRNDELQSDFEVTRSFGKYTEEVLGFIEHSDKPRPRKFRNHD